MARKDTDLEFNDTYDFEQRFADRYPFGKIKIVNSGEVPGITQEFFELKSKNLVHPDTHRFGDFYGYMRVTHRDNSVSFLAWRKPFIHNPNQWTFGIDTAIYCHDLDPKHQPIGWGEIAYWLTNRDVFFHNKPYLSSTSTKERFQNQGYDLRRTILLGAICDLIFDLPLYSSDHFLPQEKTGERTHQKTWERLVSEGVAKHFKDENHDRYVFNRGSGVWALLPGVLERIKDRRKI